MQNNIKYVCDGVSLSVVVSTIAGWLPPLAALLSIAWLCVQFYDRFKKKKITPDA